MMSPYGALAALNFLMADVRDGLGPFLGIFLQQNGWNAAAIGGVMTLAGMAAVALTTPLGVFVDQTRAKRAMLVACALLIITACGINFFAPALALTAVAQTVTAVAGAAILSLIASVTLGLVGQAGYPRQLGRNAAFRHAGTATSALLAGGLGYLFGLAAVFVLMGVLAIGAITATVMIRERNIDHEAARGGIVGQAPAPLWPALAGTPGLLVLAATVALFHLANAAMLPLLGQSMVARGSAGDGAAYTAATIVIAQGTMIAMALFAAWMAGRRGYWVVFVIALAALPIRGAIAGLVEHPLVLLPVQIPDGVGAGMMGVAVPGLVARLMNGSGHATAGLAAVMTAQAVGAACSASLGGLVALHFGYGAAFLALGGIALAPLLVWLLFGRAACVDMPGRAVPAAT